ncbi:antitoxin [Candidatus Amarolinea aalborgensis]|uniref:antitoxin n=1 Tax=Candidatus Amarolinea aalborgensis TaxID=2249329 RepID=UPI003BF99C6F
MGLDLGAKPDQEEAEILEAFEAGELERSADADELLKRHQEYAAAALRMEERFNVHLTTRDLRRLQKRALEQGIPYQILASSILHQYVEGALRESS